MTLREKQSKFVSMIADLIEYAEQRGYELTFGHTFRCAECPTGKSFSLHKLRLAVDFNLFKDGKLLTSTEDHKVLGEYWELIGGAWGGRFNDGNHYSLEHEGRK